MPHSCNASHDIPDSFSMPLPAAGAAPGDAMKCRDLGGIGKLFVFCILAETAYRIACLFMFAVSRRSHATVYRLGTLNTCQLVEKIEIAPGYSRNVYFYMEKTRQTYAHQRDLRILIIHRSKITY
jgi:hypothetical protein